MAHLASYLNADVGWLEKSAAPARARSARGASLLGTWAGRVQYSLTHSFSRQPPHLRGFGRQLSSSSFGHRGEGTKAHLKLQDVHPGRIPPCPTYRICAGESTRPNSGVFHNSHPTILQVLYPPPKQPEPRRQGSESVTCSSIKQTLAKRQEGVLYALIVSAYILSLRIR